VRVVKIVGPIQAQGDRSTLRSIRPTRAGPSWSNGNSLVATGQLFDFFWPQFGCFGIQGLPRLRNVPPKLTMSPWRPARWCHPLVPSGDAHRPGKLGMGFEFEDSRDSRIPDTHPFVTVPGFQTPILLSQSHASIHTRPARPARSAENYELWPFRASETRVSDAPKTVGV
jgi:hypothetical protein